VKKKEDGGLLKPNIEEEGREFHFGGFRQEARQSKGVLRMGEGLFGLAEELRRACEMGRSWSRGEKG